MTVTTHNAVNTGNQPLLRRVASASAIGTAAEYYDFFAYGTAAVLFFGQLFFPSADPLISTLAAFATYAVGFLARRWAASCSAISATKSAARRRW